MWRSTRAHCMSRLLAAGLAALLFAQPALAGKAETEVLAAVNAARAKAGCAALVSNPKLQAAAEGHADDMARQDFFGHAGANGSTLGRRIKAQGYRFGRAAENIAAGQATAPEVMSMWLGSAGHRRNILDCRLRETGIARAFQGDDRPLDGGSYAYRYYWVQVFATP